MCTISNRSPFLMVNIKLPEKNVLLVTSLFSAMPSKSTPILISTNKQPIDVAMIANNATGQKFFGVPSHVRGNSAVVHITSQTRYSLLAEMVVIFRSIRLFRFSEASKINTVHAPGYNRINAKYEWFSYTTKG